MRSVGTKKSVKSVCDKLRNPLDNPGFPQYNERVCWEDYALLNLTDVITNEGKVCRWQEEVSCDAFEYAFGRFPILERTPLDLVVTNKGKRVLRFQGNAVFHVGIPCDRCLKQVDVQVDIDFDFDIDMKLSDEARLEALDECDFLHGYNLDVDRLVYGEALLNWPTQILCSEDCKGLCKVCGQNLNLGTCSCDRTDLDPRMAKIRDIFANYKEV